MKFEETKRFLNDTMFLLEEEINDLSEWSVHNDDLLSQETIALKDLLTVIKEKIL